MYASIQGVYRNGKIELNELPENVREETPVIVTFLSEGEIDLRAHGIGREQATKLRASLSAFAADWDDPEMDVYDDYDAAKSTI